MRIRTEAKSKEKAGGKLKIEAMTDRCKYFRTVSLLWTADHLVKHRCSCKRSTWVKAHAVS